MFIESQGNRPVCFLATIAALTRRALPEVEEYACARLGVRGVRHWDPHRRTIQQSVFWQAGLETAEYFGGAALRKVMESRGGRMPGQDLTRLPTTGRGNVSIRGPHGGHVSPWENGRVFDSNADAIARTTGETLEVYLARYPSSRVEHIGVLPAFENPEDQTHNPPDMGY
jgi:hypothetical protein